MARNEARRHRPLRKSPDSMHLERHTAGARISILVCIFFCRFLCDVLAAGDWPRFRGPEGSGVSDVHNLPVEFGPQTNLLWKQRCLPGSSSPVIAGGRLFLAGYE